MVLSIRFPKISTGPRPKRLYRLCFQRSGFLVCVVLGGLFGMTLSEFRFCLNGPQRVMDTECPGGLILTKPLDTACMILARDMGVKSVSLDLNSTICANEDGQTLVSQNPDTAEVAADDDKLTFQDMIPTVVMDPNPNKPGIIIQDTSNCLKSCLKDWIDPAGDLEDEPEFDFGLPPPTQEIIQNNLKMSNQLYSYMTYDYNPISTGRRDLNIFDVMKEALEVLEKHCRAPFIDPEFLNVVFATLRFVSIKSGSKSQLNDLGTREHALVIDGLKKCKDNPAKFLINGTSCGSSSKIRTIDNLPYKVEAKSWRWLKFDMLIEAAWSAIEFVHGYCFREYADDLNFQHILVKAVGALFSHKVKERWMYPTQLKNNQFMNGIMGLRDANLTMRNIDACIQAGRKFSPYKHRLGRPFEKQPGSYSPTAVGMSAGRPATPSGWPNEDMNDYWAKYAARGGISAAIPAWGYCAKTAAEMAQYRQVVQSHCPPIETINDDTDPSEFDY